MKKTLLILLLFITKEIFSQEITIKIDNLPKNITEFEELRNKIANTPEGGATIFLIACQIYVTNKELGKQAITIAYDLSELSKGNWYKGYEPSNSQKYYINRLDSRPYLPFAYIKGATPENEYKIDLPYEFIFVRNQYSGDESSGRIKIFIKTYGVMPRPISLIRNDKGIWKVKESSSIFVDVQAPKQNIKDDL
ncbi:MAG: DUF6935 domain-containing protein [Leptonema sp. (in: bacteria)]